MKTRKAIDQPQVRAILDAVRESGRSDRAVSIAATGRAEAVKRLRYGQIPSVERARQLCEELGLEFYVGPPRVPERIGPVHMRLRPMGPHGPYVMRFEVWMGGQRRAALSLKSYDWSWDIHILSLVLESPDAIAEIPYINDSSGTFLDLSALQDLIAFQLERSEAA